MSIFKSLLAAMLISAGLFATSFAHHSRSNFNQDEVIELHGTVTEYSWRNPHAFATLSVTNDSGETEELLLELNSISVMIRQGWTPDTLRIGDEVTAFVNPDRDPNKNLYYSNYFVLPDGQLIASSPGGGPDEIPNAPPREIDSTARSEDLSGIWRPEGGRFGARAGGRPGSGIANQRGMSLGGQTQAVGLPVTALGQAELDTWDVADNPWFRCESKTPPWLFTTVGAHKFIREDDERIIIRHDILDVERIIYLGATEHAAGIEPSHLGHSIGWFEGETLVVDTRLFAAAKWGIGNGVSSSDQKHLVEHFTLIDDGHRMKLEYTIEDPVYLTTPVTMSMTLALDPGYPWQDEYDCDPKASSRHLTK